MLHTNERSRGRVVALTALMMVGLLVAAATAADPAKDEPVPPPKGAVVLFDGKDLGGWVSRDGGKAAPWMVKDGVMECVPGSKDIMTREKFGPDFDLHVEFWLPLMKDAKGQGRANSGVYLQGRYEVQVLDSFENDTYADGSVGALYQILTPNKEAQKKAVKPPEQWNTYDITFRAPRVEGDKVIKKGSLKVVLNGVTITEGEFDKTTGGAMDQKLGEPGPLLLQDHGNKIRFRNIWLKPLEK